MGGKFCVLNVIYHYVLYSVLVVAHNLCPNINNLNVRSWQSSTHFKGSEFLSECKLPNRKLHATFDLGRGVYLSLLAKGKNAFVDCEENQPKLPEDPTSFGIGARRTASVETLLPHKLMWKIRTAKVGQVVSAQEVSSAFPTCTRCLNFSARHLFCLRKFVSSIMSKEKDCREYATIHSSTVKQPSIWHLSQPSAQKRVAGIVALGHLSLTAGTVKINSCQGSADLLANSYKRRDYTITVHLLAFIQGQIALTSLLVLPSSFHLNLSVLSRSQGSYSHLAAVTWESAQTLWNAFYLNWP